MLVSVASCELSPCTHGLSNKVARVVIAGNLMLVLKVLPDKALDAPPKEGMCVGNAKLYV